MSLSSYQLRRAADLQEKIEAYQAELSVLLGSASIVGPAAPVPRRRGRKPKALTLAPGSAAPDQFKKTPGRRGRPRKTTSVRKTTRPRSPSGPLEPAVVKVLKRSSQPLGVKEIMDGLAQDKYIWTTKKPKATLYARIYRMPSVKRVSEGRFTAA